MFSGRKFRAIDSKCLDGRRLLRPIVGRDKVTVVFTKSQHPVSNKSPVRLILRISYFSHIVTFLCVDRLDNANPAVTRREMRLSSYGSVIFTLSTPSPMWRTGDSFASRNMWRYNKGKEYHTPWKVLVGRGSSKGGGIRGPRLQSEVWPPH